MLYSCVPRSSALPSMMMCSACSALRQRAERSSLGLSLSSMASELNGKCTRTSVHSARSGVMSTQRLLMQSCFGPQSRSVAQVLAAGGGSGALDICIDDESLVVGALAFCSCLCAHPPTTINSDNAHATRLIWAPPFGLPL